MAHRQRISGNVPQVSSTTPGLAQSQQLINQSVVYPGQLAPGLTPNSNHVNGPVYPHPNHPTSLNLLSSSGSHLNGHVFNNTGQMSPLSLGSMPQLASPFSPVFPPTQMLPGPGLQTLNLLQHQYQGQVFLNQNVTQGLPYGYTQPPIQGHIQNNMASVPVQHINNNNHNINLEQSQPEHTHVTTHQNQIVNSVNNKSNRQNGKDKNDQSAPPSSYLTSPTDPRKNILPQALPTSLNPSLKLKTGITAINAMHAFSKHDLPTLHEQTSPQFTSWDDVKDEQTTSGRGSSISSSMSPPGSSPTSPRLGRQDSNVVPCYERPTQPDVCLRCSRKVYAMESLGPVKGALYHKLCFTCVVCNTRLTLKNFYHNPSDLDDLNVFCLSHKPRDRGINVDSSSVHIKGRLNVPKLDVVNDQIRGEKSAGEVFIQRTLSGSSFSSTPGDNYYYDVQEQVPVQTQNYNLAPSSAPSTTHGVVVPLDQLLSGSVSSLDIHDHAGDFPPRSNVYKPAPMRSISDEVFANDVRNPNDFSQLSPSSVSGIAKSTSSNSLSSCSSLSTTSSRPDRPSAYSITQVNGEEDKPESTSQSTQTGDQQKPVIFRITSSDSDRTSTSSFMVDPDDDQPLSARSDRPSVNSASSLDVPIQSNQRIIVKSKSSNDVIARPTPDKSRHLPRNESYRLDRPSQYS